MSSDGTRQGGWRFRGLPSFLPHRARSTNPAAGTMSPALSSSSALKVVESIPVTSRVTLLLARGSVLDFVPRRGDVPSAIVNAANTGCLGGGGVDGAITDAGGPNLAADRRRLPVLSPDGVRCPTGSAVRTGPNRYGDLLVPYVIHAVGPNYNDFVGPTSFHGFPSYVGESDGAFYADDPADAIEVKAWGFTDANGDDRAVIDAASAVAPSRLEEGHELLRSAYRSSLDLAHEAQCQQVAFSLLSAGVFRGPVPLSRIFELTAASIQEWAYQHLDDDTSPAAPAGRKSSAVAATATAPQSRRPPMEVILCAYSPYECQTLVEACRRVFEV